MQGKHLAVFSVTLPPSPWVKAETPDDMSFIFSPGEDCVQHIAEFFLGLPVPSSGEN